MLFVLLFAAELSLLFKLVLLAPEWDWSLLAWKGAAIERFDKCVEVSGEDEKLLEFELDEVSEDMKELEASQVGEGWEMDDETILVAEE